MHKDNRVMISMITMDTLDKLRKGRTTKDKYIVGRVRPVLSSLSMRIKTRYGWWIADTTDVYIQISNMTLQFIISLYFTGVIR